MENIVNKQVVELRCYYWSAPFLWISYLSFVSKKISKSGGGGDYCESSLLPIIQNTADLILLSRISQPNTL